MEITTRGLWTLVHGMGFGALYLLACSGALVELWRRYAPNDLSPITEREEAFLRWYLLAMAFLAWITVLTGTYIIYPWYRALPPAGAVGLAGYPQRLLLSNPATSGWHSIGMEWKEHVAWLVPISITMAFAVFNRHRRNLRNHPELRGAVLSFVAISFLAAGIAGFFGAMLNKHAPVEGGQEIRFMGGAPR
ncbi:MAG: hypothetical protein ACLPH3_06795 [Terracidiphilus sp.]